MARKKRLHDGRDEHAEVVMVPDTALRAFAAKAGIPLEQLEKLRGKVGLTESWVDERGRRRTRHFVHEGVRAGSNREGDDDA